MITTVTLWIEARFPNFNDWIAAAKKGRGKFNDYSRLKDTYDRVVQLQVTAQKPPAFKSARIHFRWVEKDMKRDPDNFTSGGKKPLLDGLVLAGVLPDDGWKEVLGFSGESWSVDYKSGVFVSLVGESDGQPARPISRKYPRSERRPGRSRNGRGRTPVTSPRQINSAKNLQVEPSSGCLALINGMERIPTDD